ncbi:hypothetical protein ACF0H5_011901 [Mactra antiquata]
MTRRQSSVLVLIFLIFHPGYCRHSDTIPNDKLKALFKNLFVNLQNLIVQQTDVKGLVSEHQTLDNHTIFVDHPDIKEELMKSAAIESNLTHFEGNMTELLMRQNNSFKDSNNTEKGLDLLHFNDVTLASQTTIDKQNVSQAHEKKLNQNISTDINKHVKEQSATAAMQSTNDVSTNRPNVTDSIVRSSTTVSSVTKDATTRNVKLDVEKRNINAATEKTPGDKSYIIKSLLGSILHRTSRAYAVRQR